MHLLLLLLVLLLLSLVLQPGSGRQQLLVVLLLLPLHAGRHRRRCLYHGLLTVSFSQNVRNQNFAPPLRLARSDAAMQIFSFSPPLLCNYYCALLPTVFFPVSLSSLFLCSFPCGAIRWNETKEGGRRGEGGGRTP